MYSVSAEFLTAMNAPVQEHKVKGTIGATTFGPGNILSGSFFVTNQCSENNMLGIGQVYVGELGATFRNVGISDGAWVGQTITPVFSLKTENGWEDVPLGVFTVAEATISASGVTVKAYDNMTLFDKALVGVIEDEYPYDVLSMACTACGVTLTTTRADIEAMANGTTKVTMSGTVDTWRDVVAWIAQALGANATIDRSGHLRIFQYGSTSVATYDDAHRHSGASFADFVTRYTGISLTISATNTTYYYHDTPDDALTMELGANPFLQIGSDNDRQTACENILTDLQAVQYSPFDVNLTGCPIYDLGDILTFEDGILSTQKTGCVTYFNYVNHAAYNIKGGGKNPAEASSKSRIDKVVESMSNTVAEQVNQMSVVQNAAAATIADGNEVSVLVYNFEVTEDDNLTMLDVSIAMTSSATETVAVEVYTLADIVAQLHFYVDGSEVNVYDPRFIVDEGKDTMTFNYSLSGLSVGGHEFDIRIEMDGGSGSVAVGDVHEMLWGYGITFEVYVKNIAVTQMPTKTVYYVGQHLNYAGLEVSKVYNNGLLEDVTASCTLDPVEGTELTEYDLGTLPVQAAFEDFSTDFNLTVRDLAYKYLIGNTEMFHDTERSMYNLTMCRYVSYGNDLYCISRYMTSDYADFKYWIAKINPNIQNDDIEVLSVQSGTLTRSSNYNFKGGVVIGENWYVFELGGLAYPPKVHCINLRLGTVTQMTVTNTYAPDPSYTIWGGGWTASRIYSVGDKIFIGDISTVITKNGTNQQIWTVAYATINGTSMNVTITGETGDYDVGDNGRSIYCSYRNVVLSAPLKYKKLISTDDSCCYVYKIVIDENGYHKDLVGTYTGVGWNGSSFVTFPDLDILVFQNNDPNNRLCGYLDCDTGESYEATNTMYLAYVEGNPVWDSEKELFLLDAGLLGLKRSGDLDEWADIDCIGSESGATRVGYRYSFNGTIWTAGYTSESSGGVTTYHFYPIAYSFEGIS